MVLNIAIDYLSDHCRLVGDLFRCLVENRINDVDF